MKKYLLSFVLLTLCTIAMSAQNKVITVAGRVLDNETKEPVEMATVQLLALPDSAQAAGMVTGRNGYFSLPKVKAGKYLLRVSFIGYHTSDMPLTLTDKTPEVNVGTLSLSTDAIMLSEAVVTAEAPQVSIVEDTIMFNASAYRTPEGAMLEELVKKLPGAEVDEDGNIKINGKEITKIMVEGKEFFGGDVKTGLKNLPVDMIERLKTYDKKSDMARITGIDDGEEETVLDLKVKKGMNQGWFGNADASYGTKGRYSESLTLNRFEDGTQISLIAGANNVNDQGFSGGGGGPRWRRNNGLNATKTIGINFATEKTKLETGGSARFNYRDADIQSVNSSERFLQLGSSYSNSNNVNRNKTLDLNADFRLEWKPDTMTNIIFRPDFSYSRGRNRAQSLSGTFDEDPYLYVSNPNDYLDFGNIDNEDPLRDIRVNAINTNSRTKSHNINTNASLQVNRKLNSMGRNITFRGQFGYSDNVNDQFMQSETRYYQLMNYLGGDSILYRNQYITTPTNNYSYSAQLTYSEPIARNTFLQFSYNFQYKYSDSDRRTYSMPFDGWDINGPLPDDYRTNLVDSLSKDANYKYFNHDITASIRLIREAYQLSAGMSFQPQHTKLSYRRDEYMIDTTRNVFNFAPNIDFRYRFSKVSQLRLTYRGNNIQPSMENLLPIVDNSNPLAITMGNPGLKPAFRHNIRLFYNTYDAEKQRGIMTHANFQATQNAIANATEYNAETGGTISQPHNINGNWSAMGMFGFNTALKNKKFTINSFSRVAYNNNVAFLYDQLELRNEKNTTTELTLMERLNAAYRNDWVEVGVNGSINYSFEKNKLQPDNNQNPYTFSYGGNLNFNLPWNMTIATNIINQSRRGYVDTSMNRNEVIWNAQIAQTFFKGSTTVSVEYYDILRQQSNISRSLTASMRSVSEYNGINSYLLVHVIYRLNVFGSKAAREKMQNSRGGFGPGGHGGPPPGMGGRPRF